MRIPLIVVAAVMMSASVVTGQQVIPAGGEEDIRLYNRSQFDGAMVTLEYRSGEDRVAPPLLLRIEPGQEIVIDRILRSHFGIFDDAAGELAILGPTVVEAQWRRSSEGGGLGAWLPSISEVPTALAPAETIPRRRRAVRRGSMPEPSTLVRVGDVVAFSGSHKVSGRATLIANNVIRVTELRHDGSAPGLDMRIGHSTTARRDFLVLRVTGRQAFDGATIDVTLPDNVDLNSFDTFTVWCYVFSVIIAEGQFVRP